MRAIARRYRKNKKASFIKEIIQYIVIIVVSLAISLALKTYVVDSVSVSGRSMSPTLKSGQNMFVYRLGGLNRFDVVILKAPDYAVDDKGNQKVYVKRIIGLPGDTLEYKGDKLYINGVEYAEHYLNAARAELTQGTQLMQDRTLETMLSQVRATHPELPAENTTLVNSNGKMVIPEGYYFVLGDNRLNSHDGDDFGLVKRQFIEGVAVVRWWPLTELGIAPFQ